MAFPTEFSFSDESDFSERFLKDLLTRLGYSVVIDYHGANEYGKDLVVAEFDRFGHVRYHAIQIKYVPSISLTAVESLISDCRQAFNNPFLHPQTGQSEYISSFYGINGGSISHQATTHFFNSLRTDYGDNARLLDGKALLQLDRVAAINQLQPLRSTISGLIVEIRYNLIIATKICEVLEKLISEEGPYPMQRLRVEAVSRFLERPHPLLADQLNSLISYFESASMFNRTVDSVDKPISAGDYVKARAKAAINMKPGLDSLGNTLLATVSEKVGDLGPLISM